MCGRLFYEAKQNVEKREPCNSRFSTYDKRINEKDDEKLYYNIYLTKKMLRKKSKNISKILNFTPSKVDIIWI